LDHAEQALYGRPLAVVHLPVSGVENGVECSRHDGWSWGCPSIPMFLTRALSRVSANSPSATRRCRLLMNGFSNARWKVTRRLREPVGEENQARRRPHNDRVEADLAGSGRSASGGHDSVPRSPARRNRLPARAWIDRAELTQDPVRVSGWILHPQQPLSGVTVLLGGHPLGKASLRERPDVAALFPAVSHALLSGFDVSGRPGNEGADAQRITFIGRSADDAVEAVRECTLATRYPALATPPPLHLVRRIASRTDLHTFYTLGFQLAADAYEATEPLLAHIASPEILDWGCGCGRLAIHLRRHWPTANVHACDVDREAVHWCAQNIADVDAFVSDLHPPLPLSPDSIDLVIGSSVMTHLDRFNQQAWLDELHRVLRPGGIAALSTHGDFAASFFGLSLSAGVATDGIVDVTPDHALDAVLPPGYYRSTFQSRAYTITAFATKLRVRDYLIAGFGGFQDLIVLQKAQNGEDK
jgi:SAM-dependent methyltransferase